jgi:hypothetical protein
LHHTLGNLHESLAKLIAKPLPFRRTRKLAPYHEISDVFGVVVSPKIVEAVTSELEVRSSAILVVTAIRLVSICFSRS